MIEWLEVGNQCRLVKPKQTVHAFLSFRKENPMARDSKSGGV